MKTTLVIMAVLLLVVGTIFVSAYIAEGSAPETEEVEPASTCGSSTCGGSCGGTCGIPSCGCGR